MRNSGPVDRHHRIEKHGDIHRTRLWHAVVARPGAVILIRGLGVELELMNVDILAEQLPQRLARMRASRLNTSLKVRAANAVRAARSSRAKLPSGPA
jgi:hypothetical protein